MPKLLFVSKGLLKQTGGAETAAFQILKGILKQNRITDVIVLTNKPSNWVYNKGEDKFRASFYKKKVKIYNIPLIKPRLPIYTDLMDARRFKLGIKKILSQEDIDIIHIHTYSTFYITPESCWNIPILYTFHDFPINWPKNPFNFFPFNYIEKLWIYTAKKYWKIILNSRKNILSHIYFHCNSSDIQEYLLHKGINRHNILLLANGYEKSKVKYNPTVQSQLLRVIDPQNTKLKLLSVGQYNSIKNQHSLIMGYTEFSIKDREAVLLLVGAPTPVIGSFYIRKIWHSLSKKRRENIIWFGYVPEDVLNGLYRIADLVILMSYSEASPLILGECKQRGRVLISTKVGALKDLLPANLTKLNPNSPDSLAYELEKIYNNKDVLNKYTDLMNNSELPTWDDVGKKLCSLYNFIINS